MAKWIAASLIWLAAVVAPLSAHADIAQLYCQLNGVFVPASATNPCPTTGAVTPGSLTQVTLDIKTVTTGATAVNALSAGHRNKGGWLKNPDAAAASLCINEIGTAVGTVSSGDTTCISAGQTYTISPGAAAVSVISSDSAHPFSGMGFN